MRYCQLFESPPVGSRFYHVTTDNRLKSIMATGLEPKRHRRWRNAWGNMLGDRGFVYLMSDFTEAVRFAARFRYYLDLEHKTMKPLILVIQNLPMDKLIRDDNIEGQLARNTWYKLPGIIPPQDIVRVIALTPELTKSAVRAINLSPAQTIDEPPEEPSPDEPTPLAPRPARVGRPATSPRTV